MAIPNINQHKWCCIQHKFCCVQHKWAQLMTHPLGDNTTPAHIMLLYVEFRTTYVIIKTINAKLCEDHHHAIQRYPWAEPVWRPWDFGRDLSKIKTQVNILNRDIRCSGGLGYESVSGGLPKRIISKFVSVGTSPKSETGAICVKP